MVLSLLRSHTITLFLIEKDICDCRNVSVKTPCVYLCLLSGDLFGKISSLYSYFLNLTSHLNQLIRMEHNINPSRLRARVSLDNPFKSGTTHYYY